MCSSRKRGRKGRDSNPRSSYPDASLARTCIRPLCHLSTLFLNYLRTAGSSPCLSKAVPSATRPSPPKIGRKSRYAVTQSYTWGLGSWQQLSADRNKFFAVYIFCMILATCALRAARFKIPCPKEPPVTRANSATPSQACAEPTTTNPDLPSGVAPGGSKPTPSN